MGKAAHCHDNTCRRWIKAWVTARGGGVVGARDVMRRGLKDVKSVVRHVKRGHGGDGVVASGKVDMFG